ncbi:hypothetical protein Shyhy02_21300 [Streptomyces hygroscopicus subsp. hygroscopicus]|nr:hypothetical protein Shyhy02_21300 [Streptomyces hygroscopicus subsp. hygroscopicus]
MIRELQRTPGDQGAEIPRVPGDQGVEDGTGAMADHTFWIVAAHGR